jgi:pimeloyl-ACP methyl ester carboxylesterase
MLKGWLFPAGAPRRGLVVYLHGIGDNRQSGIGVAARIVPLGYDVLAYDARAHGESEGEFCTYGFHERHDLSRALDAIGAESAILFGSSLGAAVALQAAAVEPRVRGVIAQSPFSDLRSIVDDRARLIAARGPYVDAALALAERRAGFRTAEVSPRAAAARLAVPVLLLHGANDWRTPPAHSRRIDEALVAPHRLVLVRGAGHNDVLGHAEAWAAVETWLRDLDGRSGPGPRPSRSPAFSGLAHLH